MTETLFKKLKGAIQLKDSDSSLIEPHKILRPFPSCPAYHSLQRVQMHREKEEARLNQPVLGSGGLDQEEVKFNTSILSKKNALFQKSSYKSKKGLELLPKEKVRRIITMEREKLKLPPRPPPQPQRASLNAFKIPNLPNRISKSLRNSFSFGQIASSQENSPIIKGLLEVQSPSSDLNFSSFRNIRRAVTTKVELNPPPEIDSPTKKALKHSGTIQNLRLIRRNLNSTVKDLESSLIVQENLKKKVEEAQMFFTQYNQIVHDCTSILNKKESIIDLSSFTQDPIRKLLLSQQHLKLKLAHIKEKLMKLSQQLQLTDKKYKAIAIVTGITQLGQRANTKKYEFRKRAFFYLMKEIKSHMSKFQKERKQLNEELLQVQSERNSRLRKKLSIVKSTLYL